MADPLFLLSILREHLIPTLVCFQNQLLKLLDVGIMKALGLYIAEMTLIALEAMIGPWRHFKEVKLTAMGTMTGLRHFRKVTLINIVCTTTLIFTAEAHLEEAPILWVKCVRTRHQDRQVAFQDQCSGALAPLEGLTDAHHLRHLMAVMEDRFMILGFLSSVAILQ